MFCSVTTPGSIRFRAGTPCPSHRPGGVAFSGIVVGRRLSSSAVDVAAGDVPGQVRVPVTGGQFVDRHHHDWSTPITQKSKRWVRVGGWGVARAEHGQAPGPDRVWPPVGAAEARGPQRPEGPPQRGAKRCGRREAAPVACAGQPPPTLTRAVILPRECRAESPDVSGRRLLNVGELQCIGMDSGGIIHLDSRTIYESTLTGEITRCKRCLDLNLVIMN
jgi:hypothetical protein